MDDKRLYDYINITDLKEMLNKTKKLYDKKPTYKIKIEEGKYKIYTHKQVREMLLSEMSDAITGQVIYADSGYSIIGV